MLGDSAREADPSEWIYEMARRAADEEATELAEERSMLRQQELHEHWTAADEMARAQHDAAYEIDEMEALARTAAHQATARWPERWPGETHVEYVAREVCNAIARERAEEASEMQGATLEATEPTYTDSYASETSETCEPTECKGKENVFKCKLRRTRSSINLIEEPSPDEICKGGPVVFGGWTEPPEKKRRVLTTVDTFETPGKSDLRGRPAHQVREWVRLSSTCSHVRGYWGV